MRQIAAVVLAAGASSRFGQDKQLLDWHGKPLVAHVTGAAVDAGLRPVVVVLGCHATEISQALSSHLADEIQGGRVRVAVNWTWQSGISGSIGAGLAALPPESEAAVLVQGDQPLVSAEQFEMLVSRFADTGAAVVHSAVAGEPRPPALFARSLFRELASLKGDEGGRAVIRRHWQESEAVEVEDSVVLDDIDSPSDYDRLRDMAAEATTDLSRRQGVSLGQIRSLIIDMDGVLWHGDMPLPGIHEFFAFLRQEQVRFTLATNNSSLMPEQYSAKLGRFGVQVPPEQIVTSSEATADHVATLVPPGTRIYVLGGDGIRHALEERGFILTHDRAEIVVVGWDRQLTWDKLSTAALLIHDGARFVGTNPDDSYPTEAGPAPGNGAQLAALRATTSVEPVVVGKPEPWLYLDAMRRMGAKRETTAAIGDRLETDILGGRRTGIATILLLSGIAAREDVARAAARPDFVFTDLEDLLRAWRLELAGLRDQKGPGKPA